MRPKHFELTEDHLKLLQKMEVRWNDECYNGAPAIDIKRPYGNSDVYNDIAEILGWEIAETKYGEKELSNAQETKASVLHRETERALQIVLSTRSFVAGTYIKQSVTDGWKLI